MSKDDAEVLHSWQRTQQSTAVSTAFTLGQFLGLTELVEKGLLGFLLGVIVTLLVIRRK